MLEFIVDQPQRAADLLKEAVGTMASLALCETVSTSLPMMTPEARKQATTEKLEANGVRRSQAREGRFSMEDVFISVVEKARQEGKVAAED